MKENTTRRQHAKFVLLFEEKSWLSVLRGEVFLCKNFRPLPSI